MRKTLLMILPILVIAGCPPSDPSMSAWPTSPAWDFPIVWTIVIIGALGYIAYSLFSEFPELFNIIFGVIGMIILILMILYFVGIL